MHVANVDDPLFAFTYLRCIHVINRKTTNLLFKYHVQCFLWVRFHSRYDKLFQKGGIH